MTLGHLTVSWVPVTPTGTEDRRNTPQEAAGTPVAIGGCRLDVEGAEERGGGAQDTVTVRARLFVPYDPAMSITQHDRFVVEGATWEIHGTPDRVDSHRGPHHWEVPVRHYEA